MFIYNSVVMVCFTVLALVAFWKQNDPNYILLIFMSVMFLDRTKPLISLKFK